MKRSGARCLLALAATCAAACATAPPPVPAAPPAAAPAGEPRALVLAYQANVQGELEPCG